MPQIKISSIKSNIDRIKDKAPDLIHDSLEHVIGIKTNKRFVRFFPLQSEYFIFGPDRTNDYTIIEIMLFEGRKKEHIKKLIGHIYQKMESCLAISPVDLEVIVTEVPRSHWGIKGVTGDEREFGYKIEE